MSTEKYTRIAYYLLLRLPCFAAVNDMLKPAHFVTWLVTRLFVTSVRNTSDFTAVLGEIT